MDLKFHIWILHEKIADTYLFSHQDFVTILSYGPLKNVDEILSAKYLKSY